MMRHSIIWIAVLIILTAGLACTNAFADTGFACGPRYDENSEYREHLNQYSCYRNSMFNSQSSCREFCSFSSYCDANLLRGFWHESSEWHQDIIDICKSSCLGKKNQCAPYDTECLQKYVPQEIDCSQITDFEEWEYCNNNCNDNILTSECGKECLHAACSDTNSDAYCNNLCTDNYCASIPLHYETRWSVFGILMTLLAVMSGVILIVMHRKRKDQDAV